MLSCISRTSAISRSAFRIFSKPTCATSLHKCVISFQVPVQRLSIVTYRSFSTKNDKVDLQDKIFTIPNIMSGIRFILAPVIGYMTIKGYFLPSLYGFAIASALDFTDGYVARRFNQRSRLGTLIDPIADKALMVCLGVATGYCGLVHAPVAALIIGKDILMGLGFFGICWRHGFRKPSEMMNMVKSLEIKPSLLGKTNTALQIALFLLSLTRPIWGFPSVQLFLPLEAIVSCTTVGSLVSYALTANKAVKWSTVKTEQVEDETKEEEKKDL